MGVDVSVLHAEAFDKVPGETGLVQVGCSFLVILPPCEVCAEEPLNYTHELDLD